MKMHITEKALKEVVFPEKSASVKAFDSEVVGFGAQMTKKGTGSYFVTFRDAQGRQCHEKLAQVGAISAQSARNQARLRLQEVREAKGSGNVVRRATGKTVSEFFYEVFIPRLRSEQRSYETHASIFRNHVEPAIGTMRLDDVTEDAVLQLQEELQRKPVAAGKWKTQQGKVLSSATVKRIMILVRHIFSVGLKEKMPGLRENPTQHLRLSSTRKVRGKFMTTEELQRLVAIIAERDPDYLEMVKLLAVTGMRRGNVLNMRWDWVDLEQGTVQVPAEADKAKQGFTKVLSTPARDILLRRFNAMKEGKAASIWVFPNPKTGKPYSSRRCLWETCRKLAGLDNLRYHDLRHTFASMMLESGADIVDVQKALGHTQLKTTAVYLHLSDARKREKAEAAAVHMGF